MGAASLSKAEASLRKSGWLLPRRTAYPAYRQHIPRLTWKRQTYGNLLGPLQAECTVWAECRFVDPIADIAVLGQPDSQDLYEESEADDQSRREPP
jgi:hypothetical protein